VHWNSFLLSSYSDNQSNGSSTTEQSRAVQITDPTSSDTYPSVSRTNHSIQQTFISHRATNGSGKSTANSNDGCQPSTNFGDDVDDEFDAAVMNVDLDMFEDNIDLDLFQDDFVHDNHTNQRQISHDDINPVSVHLSGVEMKSISELLTIVSNNSFCGTLFTKVL